MHSHPDVAELPSDTARWAWVVVLLEAKLQPEPGVFRTEEHLSRAIGWRLARALPALYAAGLLERESDASRDEARLGRVTVHNWSRWQTDGRSDRTHADRQKRYREREKAKRDASRDGVTPRHPVTTSDGGPPIEGMRTVTPPADEAAVTPLREEGVDRRRDLARIVREAPNDAMRHRYRRIFDKTYGHLYERSVA